MITLLDFRDRRSRLGALILDVLVSEEIELPADVTQYPVEDGTMISDHITQGTERLRISGMISTADVSLFSVVSRVLDGGPIQGGATKLIDAIELLRLMHKVRALVTVSTGQLLYQDMGFAGITARRANGPDGGNWLEVQAQLVKIKKVRLKRAEAPAAENVQGRTGQTRTQAGRQATPSNLPTPPTPPATGAPPADNSVVQGLERRLPSVGLPRLVPGTGGT